jgi:hypothetical protein
MQVLRTLVFSAVFCASGAFAATIHVTHGDCAGEKGIEIDVKIPHEHPILKGAGIGVSEQFVFPMINSPLSTHIHVILCIYAFSILLTSLTTNLDCVGQKCVYNIECQNLGCKWCRQSDYTVSIARVLE